MPDMESLNRAAEGSEARRVSTRGNNSRGLWPGSAWLFRNAMGESLDLFVPAPVVAAIRAPLEERIRELEWALEQHRELLEAARAYRDALLEFGDLWTETELNRLLAAAAALPARQ